MWLSWWISALICGEIIAAALPGSSEHDLPRIRPRYPQFRGAIGPKGYPGPPKGTGPAAKGPAVGEPVPKETEGKAPAPKGPSYPFIATSPKAGSNEPAPKDGPGGPTLVGAIGGILGALGTAATMLAPPKVSPAVDVLTTDEIVNCRPYPDTITPDPTKLTMYSKPSHLSVTCWTRATVNGTSGKVEGSSLWLHTVGGCYISEMNVQNAIDFETKIPACPPVQHFVGTMQTQYKRQDCYECTNTNCASRNIGSVPQVELSCTKVGEVTAGNATWVKSATANCYFPGAIFQPRGWLGTGPGQCPDR